MHLGRKISGPGSEGEVISIAFYVKRPEGHVTVHSEDVFELAGGKGAGSGQFAVGITIKVVQGQEIVIYLQKKKGL